MLMLVIDAVGSDAIGMTNDETNPNDEMRMTTLQVDRLLHKTMLK